ncbi:MAG: GWxTD domain-containing protein [Bacteroidetes bacterium]|nr:MAG: GWxTD domain-containing protein [Bacteroidota bacterium]
MKYKIFLFFIILTNTFLYAQRGNLRDLKFQLDFGKRFYSDIMILPDTSSDSVIATVFYKTTYQTLTFTLNPKNGIDTYSAVPNFEVEFKDSDGIIRKRIFREDTITVNNYDETVSDDDYIYGYVSAKMKPGKYSVSGTLRCSNSQLMKNKIFPLVDFKNFQNELVISEPVLTSSLEPDRNNSVTPYLLGFGVPFSSKGASILIPVSYKNDFDKFKCTLKYTKSKDKPFDWGDIAPITGSIVPIINTTLKNEFINPSANPALSLISFHSDSGFFNQGLLNIHLTSDKILPGTYELIVVRENSKDSLKRYFNVIWENMPVVLMDPEYAAGAMYYILTDEEYDKMTDGSPQVISRKIIDYWKEKDPTKTTAYNEAMAEYFKRVVYAMQNFKNKNSKDGVKTDKGKVYILYGPPTLTNKELGEKQNSEVWKYDKIKKEFIFKTDGNGNYILISVNDLK